MKVGITIRSAQYPLGRRRPNGYAGVKGLNALLAIVSTPLCAPVVAGTRLRRGGTNSAKGAARFVADALVTTQACGGSGLVTVRADSAYYGHDVIAAARRGGARFSITARMNPTVVKAISGIAESAWVPIQSGGRGESQGPGKVTSQQVRRHVRVWSGCRAWCRRAAAMLV